MTLRPPREDEFDAMLALIRADEEAVFSEATLDADEFRTWLSSPSCDPQRDIRVLEHAGGLAGYVDVDPSDTQPRKWWSQITVAPGADVASVVPELVGWLEERADDGDLRVWTAADNEPMLAELRRLGFHEQRHSLRLKIELADEVPEPRWPDGITVRTFRPTDERALYDANHEAWQDMSDPMDETFEEWQHWTTKRASFDPSLWFLAFSGDEIAGFSLCDAPKEGRGWIPILGVRRPYRRRGLAEALLRHSFRAYAARGVRRVDLGVDASSPTGATRLYERAGMRVYRDTVFLERPVRR